MKKLIPALTITALILSFLGNSQVLAQANEPPYNFSTVQVNVWEMLKKAAKWLLNIVIFIGVIMIVWAGFTFITAGGDSAKTKKSLNIIIYALVGIGIALLAYWIINAVFGFIGVQTTVTP
jgi:energy-converting hydrogenase Eha subunit E